MDRTPLRLRRCSSLVVAWLALVSAVASTAWAENWPRFRGPSGQGASTETGLPLTWSPTENIAWKAEIPGEGWSSPIVWNDSVFVTATTDEGKSCRIICVNRKTGEVEWDREVFQQEVRHKRPDNSHATSTPTTDGERVYATFSSGSMAAVGMDGEIAWVNHDVKFFSQHGLGASPIVHEDLVIMPFDGSSPDDETVGFKKGWDGAVLLAVDKATGKEKWRGQRGSSRLAHVTPQVVTHDGAAQLVSAAGDVIQGHQLDTGKLIWTVRSKGEGVTPSPVVGDKFIYTCSGFDDPTIRAVKFGGEGDVTATHLAWEQKRGVPSIASLAYAPPHVYSVTDKGVVSCFDAATGEFAWQHRIGGKHVASPVFADGRLYFLAEADGETVVIEPGAEYKELARNTVGELCKGSIAVSQGNLFIRSDKHLFCIGAKPK